jgi:hypothetical protein
MRFDSVKGEAGGQWPSQAAKVLNRLLSAPIAAHLKFARASDANLNLITFLQIQRFYDGGRQAHGQAISPFGYLHRALLRIYIH